ncbi:hypothetical protein PHYSODRAFT_496528 [Phytophthora sojae]|uniref:MULE transposase domain-containing protein n=1 Tax=Phytophthora sojae (strain P6497) TaxID=1094619 RepID=G4Z8M8_PHYSP|nr:hypothetical protein PHYSODRAFT_496528 [Phytophthora sojae]EGZ22579.1 hypothetical protein PHYSODRAFT_496528 [Phytophthora sojae]|eukprot:XP_009525296.1 hypothetical protein PHYSODRAFT_496528 [Phytophthora sojae]
MGDADDAQFNGVERVFGESAEVKYLMCFYHVVAQVFEKYLRRHVLCSLLTLSW